MTGYEIYILIEKLRFFEVKKCLKTIASRKYFVQEIFYLFKISYKDKIVYVL